MSGTVVDNTVGESGVIAATAAGLNWNATAITASTVTVESGNGYWINTTSNTCTITLPSSATKGDQIVLIDYLRTWGTNKIIIDSNGLNYQGQTDAYDVEYNTDGQSVNIVYSDATQGWIPLDDDASAYEPTPPPTQKALFGYGSGVTAITNLVSSSGVVSTDTAGVGTARTYLGGASYGGDKAIFGYGYNGSADVSLTNLVSNSGVVATDTAGVGTARSYLAAAEYGTDKALFGYGYTSSAVSLTNLVSNTGVVAADVSGVGTARNALAAATYGTDKAIFGYGIASGIVSLTNLVNNLGVVAADVTGVGSARNALTATNYGGDKALFGFGVPSGGASAITNLVSSSGVVATDTAGVGTARYYPAAAGFSNSA